VRGRYPRPQDLHRALLERIEALPGVVAAAAISQRPLLGQTGYDWPVTVEGQSDDQAQRNPIVNLEQITPRYFEAMQIALLRGRAFTEHDHERAPGVVVVSRNLAQHHWPGQDALGKRLKIPLPGTPLHDAWLTVIGVVGEVRYRELQGARPDLYISYRQGNLPLGYLVVRSQGDSAAPAASVRAAIRSVYPQLVVSGMLTRPAVVGGAMGGARFGMQLAATFAVAALVLAALGIYGVVAFVVGRRTREIGVRLALGARRSDVMKLVLGQGMAPTLVGLLAGLMGALALGRALRASLFGVTAHEPALLAAAAAALTATALAACALPAWRAARTDPARALREE